MSTKQTARVLELRKIMNLLSEFFNRDKDKLVRFLQKEGYTNVQIGNVIGVTRQRISTQYPSEQNHQGKGVNE